MQNIENIKKDLYEFINGFKNMFNDLKTKGRRYRQIPNLITLSRLIFAILIPPFAISGNLPIAAVLTVIAATTDGIDGLVARKLNATSEFGKNLDPVCDKIFAGALLIPLMTKLSPLITLGLGVNLAFEIGIAGVNLNSKAKGNLPRTTILGKIKTGLLSLLLAILYASFSYQALTTFIPVIYVLATSTQCLALINYHQIDKKKELKKQKLELFNDNNEIKEINEQVEKHENIQKYTVEDYRKLKDEVIKTQVNSHEKQSDIIEEHFQKTKNNKFL